MKHLTLVVCILHLCIASFAQDDAPKTESSTLIQNVTVVDVVSGQLIANQAIALQGDRITFVGDSSASPESDFDLTIDASGKFAIPGLWDMHIHTFNEKSMELFPINGVVGTRVMWGMAMHHNWRKRFESGEKLGPRMIIASAIIDGKNPIWPGSIVATNRAEGIEAIEKAIKFKADFAKVYSLLPREAFLAISEKCKEEKLPFDGHVPLVISPTEASNAGQRSMAHMYELILGCSSREKELREIRIKHVEANEGNVRSLFGGEAPPTLRRAYESYDEQKAQQLFATLKKNGTWQCPTLTVLHNLAYLTDAKVQDNPNLKYLNKMMRNFIAPKARQSNQNEDDIKFEQQKFKMNLKILASMHSAGVPILAGTDVLNPFCLPGFSLHDELQFMVDAGLTPLDALQTATINPARFQKKETTFGSIANGKAADIVLLNANPLEKISNTRKIDTVIIRGVVMDRKRLDEKLKEFEEAGK